MSKISSVLQFCHEKFECAIDLHTPQEVARASEQWDAQLPRAAVLAPQHGARNMCCTDVDLALHGTECVDRWCKDLDTHVPTTIHRKKDAGANPPVLLYVYSFVSPSRLEPNRDFRSSVERSAEKL